MIVEYFPDGDVFVCDVKNGMKNGKGILFCKNGCRLESIWKDNVVDDKMVYFFTNGTNIKCEWTDGMMNTSTPTDGCPEVRIFIH